MEKNPQKNPIQPVFRDKNGTIRFKSNPIVEFMLEELTRKGFNLNSLVVAEIPKAKVHDWDQFYQLVGYSVANAPIRNKKTQENADALALEYSIQFPRKSKTRPLKGVLKL